MHIERVNSAHRTALVIVVLYVCWKFGPNIVASVGNYTHLVGESARASRQLAASKVDKLSAANLESMLLASKQFPPDSHPQCQPAALNWDYVCSYMPKARQSSARLQFGVDVDATRWVKVSSIVPAGKPLPAPHP